MSGSAPMLNQLHKMAMMRKRTLIGDNELYEMMRSRQVYHVQTDLQKRLSETINSLEHDRELALAGILSRKLIFLRQVGKRERKRKKLVNVKKEMDEILRDADLEQLSSSLNQVWESNQPDAKESDHAENKDKNDRFERSFEGGDKETFGPPKETLINVVDGSSKNLKRIEKGVDLYLASTNLAGRLRRRGNDDYKKGKIRANKLPSIVLSVPPADKAEVKTIAKNDLLPLPPAGHSSRHVQNKGSWDTKVTEKTLELDKITEPKDCRNVTDTPLKTFQTEPTDMIVKVSGKGELAKGAAPQTAPALSKEKSSTYKPLKEVKTSRPTRNKEIYVSARRRKSERQNDSNGAITLPECTKHGLDDKHINVTPEQRNIDLTNQSLGVELEGKVLKPYPPYLMSKPKPGVRAVTSLSSSKPNSLRACMERTVTMIYVEDSEVKTPKSSFDIDAWLNFIRQKKGYSATLKDGPLERLADDPDPNTKVGDSKRNVKFAIRRRKLKALRPTCKTSRDRAMDWFKEFSTLVKKNKKRLSRKNNLSKAQSLPDLRDLSPHNPKTLQAEKKTELPHLKRETTSQLLQKIREDSKLLQEKVHHLCNDDYWKL